MSEHQWKLVKEIAEFMISNKKTLSVAESCTGGKISSIITSFSGSSIFFKGGIVAYSNQVKIDQLSVNGKDLEEHTAVSDKVAIQMAKGVKEKLQSDYSLATTGYAGPTGYKLGQVFIAFSSKDKTISLANFFEGKRNEVVTQASIKALDILLSEIKK